MVRLRPGNAVLLVTLGVTSSAFLPASAQASPKPPAPTRVAFECTRTDQAGNDETLHVVAPHAETRTDVLIAQGSSGPIASLSLANCTYTPLPVQQIPVRGLY